MSDETKLRAIHADYQAGRLDVAETKLAEYSKSFPEDMQALHLAAMVAARSGDYRSALTRIQASLRDSKNAHEKLNVQGNILRGLGADIDAQTSFESALSVQPGFQPARANLASLLLATSQPLEAARHLSRLREQGKGSRDLDRAEIEALIEANRLEAALERLDRVALDPADASALRARIAFYQGRYEDVLGEASRAVASPRLGSQALASALQTLQLTGGWEMAGGVIEDVLSQFSARGDLWAVAIRSLHKAGRTDEALQLYGRAPRDVTTMLARADISLDQGHFADTEDLAMQALSIQRGHAPAMRILCLASLGLGADDSSKLDQAQQVADLGLQANPNDQFYYAVKATAGRAKGQDYKFYFDTDRFVRVYDLDPPEGWEDMESFNTDLADELDGLHNFSDAPLDQTLRAGTQTAPDLRFVDSPAIQGFFRAVAPAIESYLDEIGHDPRHAFLRRNIGGFRVRSAWSVRLGKGGHHVNHIHPEGWISSSYYVRMPQTTGKEGWIAFGQPPADIAQALGQDAEHIVQPKAGRLVLFPSYLWHGTVPLSDADDDELRMTLPIDILPAKPAST